MSDATEPKDAVHPEVDPELLELHEYMEAAGLREVPEGATGEAVEIDPVAEGGEIE